MTREIEIDLTGGDLDSNGDRAVWVWETPDDTSAGLVLGVKATGLRVDVNREVITHARFRGEEVVKIVNHQRYVLPARNVGHGRVFLRPDGVRDCPDGPYCLRCALDLGRLRRGQGPEEDE